MAASSQAAHQVPGTGVVETSEIEEPLILDEMVLTKTVVTWSYYEDEDQVEDLLERLNPKGVREKKLQEGLRKIKDRLKLKKSKKPKKQPDASNEESKANTVLTK